MLVNSWKVFFKLTESANSQRARAKINVSVDAAAEPQNLFDSTRIKSEI